MFSLTVVFNSNIFAQSIHENKNDTTGLITHKWEITNLEAQGKKISVPPNSNGIMQFNPDGTAIIFEAEKGHKENWKYDNKNKTIMRDGNFVIIKISKDSLILFSDADKMKMNIYLKRVG